MSLVKEPGVVVVAQFTPPYKGTWNSVAANEITPDALFDSLNVYLRRGKVRTRPGLSLLNTTVFDLPIIGGKMAVTPAEKVLLATTRNSLYRLRSYETNWNLDTAINFANSSNSFVDTTFLETNNQYVAVFANPSYPLKRWIDGFGCAAIVATIGSVPIAKSVCTTSSRIVALVDPHTLVWSQILDYTAWSALAIAKVASTNDQGICVRSLSTLDFVLYKERSIYLAKSQAGSDAVAFAIAPPIIVEGPASVQAVVDADSQHVYMTKNGRIGIFDGTSKVQWIADGLWLFLQEDIDTLYTNKIFGVFDYRLHTVTFYYPKQGDEGLVKGIVIINLPMQGSGIELTAAFSRYVATAFLGVSSKPVSYGYEMRFNNQIDRSLIFTVEDQVAFSCLSNDLATSDNGALFNCAIQTGLAPLKDLRHYQLNVESYFERNDGYGFVNIFAVTSDILDTETGDIHSELQVIDLNSNPNREYVGFNIPATFFGLRYEWQSDSMVRYNGATVYGRALS